eukprot:1112682-Amphidinium_carterae.2
MKWSRPLSVGDKYLFLKQQRVITENGVFLCANDKYVEDILSSLSLLKCAPSPTPITSLRPDINYVVKELSHILQNPSEEDFMRLKRLGRYLAGTRQLGLLFAPHEGGDMESQEDRDMMMCWTDSDWASERAQRKSTSSFVISYRNCVLYDLARQQGVIAQSSAEAEVYAAASGVSCEVLIHKTLKWMGVGVSDQIGLAMDSSAGKAVISRLGVGSIRHLEVKTMWLQLLHKSKALKAEGMGREECCRCWH